MSKYCVCFCRVSTIQQDLSQQTAAIRAEARKMGYSDDCQIVIEYKESGISLSSDEREGISALKSEKKDWQNKADKILLEISENISNMKSLMEHSKIDMDSLSFREKYDIVHKMVEKVELSKPYPQLRFTLAEIYTKVDNKVYVYGIYTKDIKWKLLEVKKRG